MSVPMLVFEASPWVERTLMGWTGPWPPPERLLVGVGRTSGYVTFVDPKAATVDELRTLHELATVVTYCRKTYSKLSAAVDKSDHLFRGATYELAPFSREQS